MRLIIVSTESGEREEVTFTEDTTTPAEDYCAPGQTVDFDGDIDCDLPGGFPLESTLLRT